MNLMWCFDDDNTRLNLELSVKILVPGQGPVLNTEGLEVKRVDLKSTKQLKKSEQQREKKRWANNKLV